MDRVVAEHTVEEIAESGALTRDEVLAVYDRVAHPAATEQTDVRLGSTSEAAALPEPKHLSINEIMYYIGAAIVVLGVTLLIGQNWELLSFSGRLLVTIGLGLVMFLAGTYLIREKKTESVGSAFHVVAAFALTAGMAVLFDGAGRDVSANDSIALQAGALLLVYAATFYLVRNVVFALLTIVFSSAFFWYLLGAVVGDISEDWTFAAMRFMGLGVAYLVLAYALTKTRFNRLNRALYGFGTLFLLGGALGMAETEASGQFLWEIMLYPLFLVSGFYYSTVVRSGAMLVWSTVFLMIYIMVISGKYFAESIGWPIALMFAGLALIGTGYLAVTLKKRYIAKS